MIAAASGVACLAAFFVSVGDVSATRFYAQKFSFRSSVGRCIRMASEICDRPLTTTHACIEMFVLLFPISAAAALQPPPHVGGLGRCLRRLLDPIIIQGTVTGTYEPHRTLPL